MQDLAKFHEAQELNFPLLSDPDGSAAGKFGVLGDRGYARRVTFVIDGKGVLLHVDEAVQVASHGEDLVAVLEELRSR